MPQISPRTRTVFRILALAAWAVSLAGQINNGRIVGRVAGPSGPVPEAKIVLRSGSTGVRFRSQTNDAGRFQSPPLRPDSCEVYVRKAGFRTGTATVTLAVQQRAPS
jgi:hypothetical protein